MFVQGTLFHFSEVGALKLMTFVHPPTHSTLQPVLEVYRLKFEVCIQFYSQKIHLRAVKLNTDLKFWSVNLQNGVRSVKRLNSPYLEVYKPQFEVCNRILQPEYSFEGCKIEYRP